jgi:hypothetical protein
MLSGWEVMMLLGALAIYFIPTIIAIARNHHRALGIFLANFFSRLDRTRMAHCAGLRVSRRREPQPA